MKPSIMIITGAVVLGLLFLFAKTCFTGSEEDPEIRKIQEDPSLHPIEKRALIDGIREKNRSIENAKKNLKDPKTQFRMYAIDTLGANNVRDAIPAIREALKDADPDVRGMAAIALIELGEQTSVPPTMTEDMKRHLIRGIDVGRRATKALKQCGISDEEIKQAEVPFRKKN